MDRRELEHAVALARELKDRYRDDPWWTYKPTEKQHRFLDAILNGHTTEAWLICANRTGKTDGAAYAGAGLARFGRNVPGWSSLPIDPRPTKGWVISATSGASRTVVQPKYFDNGYAGSESHPPFIPSREVEGFNINEQTLKLKNGSIIEFKTAEAKTISMAGAGLDWVHVDEELPKAKYDEIIIRIGGGKRLLLFGACTLLPPEGQIGGVSWMFGDKIKPWIAAGGSEESIPPNWHGSYLLFGASIYDNPYLLPEEIARLESRYPAGSPERMIRLEGRWIAGMQGSRAYPAFDTRIHVRPQASFNSRRPICWIHDFNVEPLVSLLGQRDGDTFRVMRELVLEQGSIPEMVDYFREVIPAHNSEVWIYGDATGKNRHPQTGRSEYQVLVNHMRTYNVPVRLKVPEKNPNVPDRINALQMAFRDERGVSHVEIDPSCVELIADLEEVLRDHRGGIKKTHDRKDPYYRRTHTSDALGYWISYERPVRLARPNTSEVTTKIRQPSYNHATH
jgi:hypothetical protein